MGWDDDLEGERKGTQEGSHEKPPFVCALVGKTEVHFEGGVFLH